MSDPFDNPPATRRAQFVRRARKRLGLTQTELGAALGGATRLTIYRYEIGSRKVPPTVIMVIKRLLTEHREHKREQS